MEQLQPIFDLLSGQHGWSPAVLGWMASMRLALKPVSIGLQNVFARLFAFVHETAEADDDAFVAGMLRRRWYRAVVFLVDLATSIKLPTSLPRAGTNSTKFHE